MKVFDLTRECGWVRLSGATRLDFLHRMSSNDMLKLGLGDGRMTALTTPIGRMIDCVLAIGMPDALLLMTGRGNAEKVARWLRKYVFFNDDVQASPIEVGAAYGVFEVAAAPAGGVRWMAEGWVLIDPSDQPAMVEPGAAFEPYRIGRGWPRFPTEIGEDYIPLEAGLRAAVSFNKGCYIGQEIIARMDSRNQVAKRLMRLRVEGAARPGETLLANAVPAGTLTSISGVDAIGFVRAAHAKVGAILSTAGGAMVTVVGEAGMGVMRDAPSPGPMGRSLLASD